MIPNVIDEEKITLFAQCLSREIGITFKVKPRSEGSWGYTVYNDDYLGEEPKKLISYFVSESEYTAKKRIFIKFTSPYAYKEFSFGEIGCSSHTLCEFRTIGRISNDLQSILAKLKSYHTMDVEHRKKLIKLSKLCANDIAIFADNGAEDIRIKIERHPDHFYGVDNIDRLADHVFEQLLKTGKVEIVFSKHRSKCDISYDSSGFRTMTISQISNEQIIGVIKNG